MPKLPFARILVRGADAFDFLQGQLTNDLRLLDGAESQRAAWCNPKGRVICLLRVGRIDGGYALTLPSELADDVVRRLTLFRFRARVDFAIEPAAAGLHGIVADADDFLAEQIRRGIPEIWREQSEKFTPHMLNLDLLDAISFDKGCYTGQEVVARTHYRGATKRRCLRFESAEPVAPGAKVAAGERDVGEVLNAAGTDLLAIVPRDKADSNLTVRGIPLRHVALPYLPPASGPGS